MYGPYVQDWSSFTVTLESRRSGRRVAVAVAGDDARHAVRRVRAWQRSGADNFSVRSARVVACDVDAGPVVGAIEVTDC